MDTMPCELADGNSLLDDTFADELGGLQQQQQQQQWEAHAGTAAAAARTPAEDRGG